MLEKILDKTVIDLPSETVELTLYQKDDGHACVHEKVYNGKWGYSFVHCCTDSLYPIDHYHNRINYYTPP